MDPRTRSEGQGSATRNMSTGRGGAGNIGKPRRESFTTPQDLITPTIKSDTYTTGRGGTGNMAKNDPLHPQLARASQDVEPPPHREPEGVIHFGRGGAANVTTLPEEENKLAKEHSQHRPRELERSRTNEDAKGWADKGKGILNKIGLGGDAKK